MCKEEELMQTLTRKYLNRIMLMSDKYQIRSYVSDLIEKNLKGECISTKEDVELLAKIVDEDCIKVREIPKVLGVSYRYIIDNNIKFKKLEDKGRISKVDVLLVKERLKDKLKK